MFVFNQRCGPVLYGLLGFDCRLDFVSSLLLTLKSFITAVKSQKWINVGYGSAQKIPAPQHSNKGSLSTTICLVVYKKIKDEWLIAPFRYRKVDICLGSYLPGGVAGSPDWWMDPHPHTCPATPGIPWAQQGGGDRQQPRLPAQMTREEEAGRAATHILDYNLSDLPHTDTALMQIWIFKFKWSGSSSEWIKTADPDPTYRIDADSTRYATLFLSEEQTDSH